MKTPKDKAGATVSLLEHEFGEPKEPDMSRLRKWLPKLPGRLCAYAGRDFDRRLG